MTKTDDCALLPARIVADYDGHLNAISVARASMDFERLIGRSIEIERSEWLSVGERPRDITRIAMVGFAKR